MICGQTHGPTLGMGWQHVCGLRLRVDCLDGNHSISDMVFPCIASTTMADMDAVDIAEPQHHNHQHPHPRPQSRQQNAVKTGTWLPAEDVRLREAVAKYGTRWVRVAGEVGTRNGDQCAKRWNENLNPELDHGPWTAEEDERLLNMVNTYGHNWKFMADSFLELRAPLALKNRYSLLMRRLNRQGTGQQEAANTGGAKPPRHAAPSRPSSANASPSPNTAVDLTSFFVGGRDPNSHRPDYATMSAASSNFPFSTDPFGAVMIPRGDDTATRGRRGGRGGGGGGGGGGAALWTTTATTASDDQGLTWQQHPFLGGWMEPGIVSSSTGSNGAENELVEEMTTTSDNGTGSRRLPQSGGGSELRSAAVSDGENSGIAPGAGVEYSVTCQWGKLKTLMNHLVDAAMSESAEWTAEDDRVTITFGLKV